MTITLAPEDIAAFRLTLAERAVDDVEPLDGLAAGDARREAIVRRIALVDRLLAETR